jgi:hypothetical protein
MSHTKRLTLIAGLMTVFLVFMLGSNTLHRATGREVVLDVTGFDPRDPFLGHYSRIRLDITRLNARELAGEDVFVAGQTIFVGLEAGDDGAWHPVALHPTRPGDGIAIQGVVAESWIDRRATGTQDDGPASRRSYRIDYGLNRYFADRATAQDLDDILRDDTRTPRLIIALADNGRALIKGIEIDGEPHYERLW